ncbi:MAG: TonB-dependent receptor [Pseudomonadota bacterium]
MNRLNTLSSCMALAAVGYTGLVNAQTPLPVQTLPRVEITGSNIKRIDTETATPVQTVRREDIARLGVSSVKELLDTLSSADSGINTLSDISGSNSFAGGASAASMRNLGKESTLILLNARRVAPYALADYNEVFTNLDALPLEAVERVEILRNGGSAIYGSDAVGGVVNIITRRDYQGLQASASREESLKNRRYANSTASLTGGFGNLEQDRYNVLVNVELYKRGSVVQRDVLDDINPIYGEKFVSLREGSGRMFGNRGAPSTFSYPGNIVGNVGGNPLPGCTTVAAGNCFYDRTTRFELVPASERANMLLAGRVRFSDALESYSELLLSKTKTTYQAPFATYANSANAAPIVWGNPVTGQIKTFYYRGLPATHPLNTTGQDDADFRYRFVDAIGESVNDASQYRLLTGLKGSWGNYEWDSAIGVMGSTAKDRSRGNFSESGFLQLIGNYDPAQTDATFFNKPGGYRIGQPNSDAVINTLFPAHGTDGEIKQYFWDGKISGDVGTINDRPIAMALGFDVRRESFTITPTANRLAGDIVGYGSAATDASRTHSSVFAEVNLPVTQSLEVTGAARLDSFPGFAAHWSPKIGAAFKASEKLLLRSTVETGFRAPNLTESAQSTKVSFTSAVSDPQRCAQTRALANNLRAAADALPANDPNAALQYARADSIETNECATSIANITLNNPNLKPEETLSATLGFVLQPTPSTSMSLDYFNIERKNEIANKTARELLASEASLPPGVITRNSLAQDTTFSAVERVLYGVTVGPLASLRQQFENVSKTKTSGVDIAAQSRVDTGWGKLDLGMTATYLMELSKFSATLNAYGYNLAGTYTYPKLTLNLTANLRTGAFSNGLRAAYQSSTTLSGDFNDQDYNEVGCESLGWTASECRVGDYVRWDYNLSYTGIKNLTLTAFVRNILDRRPPYDLRALNETGGGQILQGFQDTQGRSLRLKAEYKFW